MMANFKYSVPALVINNSFEVMIPFFSHAMLILQAALSIFVKIFCPLNGLIKYFCMMWDGRSQGRLI